MRSIRRDGVLLLEPWGSGGIHTYTLALADAMASRGIPVEVLSGVHASPLPESAEVVQLPLLEDFLQKPTSGPAGRVWSFGRHLSNRRTLASTVHSSASAVLHVQWPLNKFGAAVLERVAVELPVVVTAHNALPHDCDDQAVIAYWRQVYLAADAVICHSTQTQGALAEAFGEPLAGRTRVIPHGVGVPRWLPSQLPDKPLARRMLGLGSNPYVLFFGAIRPYKGLDLLVEAWPLVKERIPDAILLVAGSGATWDQIQPRIHELGLDRSVEARIGWVPEEDIPAYMSSCDLAVLPYRHIDGSGIAAACAYYRLPMVLSDIPGFRAAVGSEAALFADLTPVSIAAAICDLLQDSKLSGRLASNAYSEWMRTGSWDECAKQHLELYDQVMARRLK